MTKLIPHPIADMFPEMNEEEFLSLKEDIKENGLRHPILIYEGKILDGRHRYKACEELGIINFKSEVVNEKATERVISENINRRHLNQAQRTMISLKLYDILKPKSLTNRAFNPAPKTKEEKRQRLTAYAVAKTFGVGVSSVIRAIGIRRHVPHLIPNIMKGEMGLGAAYSFVPKNGSRKTIVTDKAAATILRQFDVASLQLPSPFDSYEKIINEFANKLNDAGYIMQWVFHARKKYVRIIKETENFDAWRNAHCEYDLRTCLAIEARSKLSKHVQQKAA
jgi:hypothetical protein